MDIILTHARADFDAFASMLCASKLFPQAVPVLPSTLIYKLREVLSLYRNLADFRQIRFLRKTKNLVLDKVILVDTKKHGQLKEFEPFLEMAGSLVIYDHHPPTLDDITTGSLELFPCGANTTGLFFKLMDQGLSLTPQEATIVLLGIYADTGNLTYPGTTAEDALAAGELLRLEADLQTVNHYLRPYFDPAQRFVFREMLSSVQEMDMAGYKVVIIKQMLEKPLQGISELISHVSDMVGADAIVGIFASETKPGVQIIVQSLVPEINAGEITARFGGGGHPGAGAALADRGEIDGVADDLLRLLAKTPLPNTKVKDVMTSAVMTIPPDMPLQETAAWLTRNNVHGAPVVDETGELVGVISSRDVEKARLADLLHAPTNGFMSRKIVTTQPEAPLITAKKIISSRDIGRLPVMEENRLVGILSRSDILGALNGNTNQRAAGP